MVFKTFEKCIYFFTHIFKLSCHALDVIKNKNTLLSHGDKKIRKVLLEIADRTLERIGADKIISENVRIENENLIVKNYSLPLNFEKIIVIGFGKAAVPMAKEMESILGNRITKGMINSPYKAKLNRIEVNLASHPYPDARTLQASQKIIELLEEANENTLVIVLISGGASSLFEIPQRISIEEEKEIIEKVMTAGADIIELNKLRIALSKVKGGKLLSYIAPAKCLSLIISDVIGPPKFVGSGPTYPQKYDVSKILKKYGIEINIRKNEDLPIHGCKNIILADNTYALKMAKSIAEDMGIRARVSHNKLSGEPRYTAKNILREMGKGLVIWGGETAVKIQGGGIGGRNQELSLYLAKEMKRHMGFICLGTDGIDGPTDAAGGLVDYTSMERIAEKGIDLDKELMAHNSYAVLKKIDDAIFTGYTNTNLADICIGFHP